MRIEEFSEEHTNAVIELVHGVLQDEFGFSESDAPQPDLLDIEQNYGDGWSNFWLALEGDRLVGTIGFRDLGSGRGLLRKMFVERPQRGNGTAERLLGRLLSWAKMHGFEDLFLGTNSKFHAAHRFYLKHDFEQIQAEELPDEMPRIELRDRFFHRSLVRVR